MYTATKHRGFVMISYYDIRHARNAKTALQSKPLRRRKLDIHYSIPKVNTFVSYFNISYSQYHSLLIYLIFLHRRIRQIKI